MIKKDKIKFVGAILFFLLLPLIVMLVQVIGGYYLGKLVMVLGIVGLIYFIAVV